MPISSGSPSTIKWNSKSKNYMETRRITELFNLNFPFAKNIIVSGDIHGEFNTLVLESIYHT